MSGKSVFSAASFALLVAVLVGAVLTPSAATPMSLDEIHGSFPGAETVGTMEGQPPAAPVQRDGRLAGYVFRTNAVIPTAGFSGRPIDILVGLDLDGIITGAYLLEHHEPILTIGISDARLQDFIASHRGLDIKDPDVLSLTAAGRSGVDVISGATVSSLVMNDNIIRAARLVAHSRGLLDGARPSGIDTDYDEPATWEELLADGSVVQRRLEGEAQGSEPPPLLIDLYLALAVPPRIGRNLLGDRTYTTLRAELQPDDAIILIAANGLYSFKGTSYVRTNEFDRIRISQDGRDFALRSDAHQRLTALTAAGAPNFREIGLFVITADEGFDITKPWSLELRLDTPAAGDAAETPVEIPYRLPEPYLVAESPAVPASNSGGAGMSGGQGTETPATPAASVRDPLVRRLESTMRVVLVVLTGVILALGGLLACLQRFR